jgi:DNA-binding IscR family transcriptional regulator
MNRDSRLSVALHVLLHMSEMRSAATSEALGSIMNTNPVVIRRTLGGLRDAGIVDAEKGHGGGWTLARDLRSVTLADIYDALGTTTPFGIGVRDPQPTCPIEKGVNRALGEALREAEALLMTRLRSVAVTDILKKATRSRAGASRRE